MTTWIQRALGSGLAIWASLFATLVLVAVILFAIFGPTSGILIFAIVGAVVMGVSGMLLLKRMVG